MPGVRLPQPSEMEHEARLANIDAKIGIFRSKIDDTYNEMKDIRETGKTRMGSSTSEFIADTRSSKKLLGEERRALIDELRSIKREFYSMIEENKKIKNKVKVLEYEKVDSEIRSIKRRLETTSVSLAEEKRLVTELKDLEQSKPFTLQFKERKDLIDANRKRQDEIQAILDSNENRRKEIEDSV
jgi:uncharacterized coiled-coil DUF342 family protein